MVGVTRMELIASDKKRELKFRGRVKGLKKKAYELSTLCGLDIGMIISSPFDGQIQTLSWPNQDGDGKTLIDLISRYKNQDGKPRKTVKISKKETQVVCESQLDAKSNLSVSGSSQLGEQSGPSISCHSQLSGNEKQPQASDDDTSFIQDYEMMDDLNFLLNNIMDQPVTPIEEDVGTAWPQDFPSLVQPTSNNDTSRHSNIPSVMATGGYPMSSQVMIGRAALYNSDQLCYNPNPWRTPY